MPPPVLSIESLSVSYQTEAGRVRAVDDISLQVQPGARVGVVGESGCGKSTVALSVLRLIDDPPGRIDAGKVLLGDTDLLTLREREMCAIRGRRISMVFQEPLSSLNPVQTVGAQVMEALRTHHKLARREARARVLAMFDRVGLPASSERFGWYPHQLSGGMRQRVMIAMALICGPELVLADEPTTALDVTIQAQILELLVQVQKETSTAIVLITHDLGVLASFAEYVVVMYAGQVVEEAPVGALFRRAAHPYTRALLDCLPSGARASRRMTAIAGRVPDLRALPPGCRFADRCSHVQQDCREKALPLGPIGPGRKVRCLHPLVEDAS
jgi:peptide/nickel transport system ATP-binding protein